MSERFDAVIIGAGLSGQACAHRLRAGGMSVAVVEAHLIGGLTAYWTEIPMPSLIGPTNLVRQLALASGIASPPVSGRNRGATPRGAVHHKQLPQRTDEYQARQLHDEGISVVRGRARLRGTGQITVEQQGHERQLETARVVIATGTTPRAPEIQGLQETGYWTPREAITFTLLPPSVIVLGGGTHAIELAQLFRIYGAEVTIVTQSPHLMPYEDPEVGDLLAQHLYHKGMRVITGHRALSAQRNPGGGSCSLTLDDGSRVEGEQVVIAAGREPSIAGLDIERAGVHTEPRGIRVDEYCRAGENVWAIGDVTGAGASIHMAQYQARIAADDILGHSHPAYLGSVPRIAFTDPQVATAGLSAARARELGKDVASAIVDLPGSPSTPGARLALHADRAGGVLLGVWAVAPDAQEWFPPAALAIRAAIPIAVLHDALEQFPRYGDAYLQALDRLLAQGAR